MRDFLANLEMQVTLDTWIMVQSNRLLCYIQLFHSIHLIRVILIRNVQGAKVALSVETSECSSCVLFETCGGLEN